MWGRKQRRYTINHSGGLQPVWRLSVALIASMALNVLLAGAWLYPLFWTGERTRDTSFHLSTQMDAQSIIEDRTNSEVLQAMTHMLPEQLVSSLRDTLLVEDGYNHRDLALGCLVTLHHLDIARAIPSNELPMPRRLSTGKNTAPPILVYPGLSEKQFNEIQEFIARERWPLTAKGLFLALQQQEFTDDPSLIDSFALTGEFLAIRRLISLNNNDVNAELLLQMVVDGDWNTLSSFVSQAQQISENRELLRRKLLVEYVQMGSRAGAALLVQIEPYYALKRLDDTTLLHILRLLADTNIDITEFAKQVVDSPRSEAVVLVARELAGPVVSTVLEAPPAPATPSQKADYIVQKGDSLWKIAKKTGVSISGLKKHNNLQSDRLLPGDRLRLPTTS